MFLANPVVIFAEGDTYVMKMQIICHGLTARLAKQGIHLVKGYAFSQHHSRRAPKA
jgi:hypothetical protein